MGHLGRLKEEYRSLVRRLEAGTVALPEPEDPRAWEGFREILEILFSPAEAELASRMPVLPASLERLSARFGMPPEELKARLDPLCDKGLVMDLIHPDTGRARYLLAPPLVGFFEFSMMRANDGLPKKRLAEAYDAYLHGDAAFAREAFRGETRLGRALVHETALGDGPMPEVLDWERASALVAESRTAAVSLCFCRHVAEHLGRRCDAPIENCLSLNGGAAFIAHRGFGRAIEKSEAMDILAASREKGLAQIADNVMNRPTFICNCCGCCCEQLRAISAFDLVAVNPSGFAPAFDLARCKGCSRCSRACPVTAISMTPRRVEARRKNTLVPSLDEGRCIGCGVCAGACRSGALAMRRRAERPFVPATVVEKSIRMALERGRLAHLFFDEGAGRGSRFLNGLVGALAALPAAERLLASEQVRSRFVRATLARVKDPTGG